LLKTAVRSLGAAIYFRISTGLSSLAFGLATRRKHFNIGGPDVLRLLTFFVMYLVVVLIDRLFDEHLLTACGTTSTSRDVRFWSVHEIKPEVTLILAEFRS
jgi:hypothetical protein